MPSLRSVLTRDKLALFLPTHELVKAFENLLTVVEPMPDEIIVLTRATERAVYLAQVATALTVTAQAAANQAEAALEILLELIDTTGVEALPASLGAQAAQIQALANRIKILEEAPL